MASSVDLGGRLEAFVLQLVKTGRYNSRSEVLREGVRIIHEREIRLAALDASVNGGPPIEANGSLSGTPPEEPSVLSPEQIPSHDPPQNAGGQLPWFYATQTLTPFFGRE